LREGTGVATRQRVAGAADEAAAQLGQRLDHQVGRGRDAAHVNHQRVQLALRAAAAPAARSSRARWPRDARMVAAATWVQQRRHQQRARARAQARRGCCRASPWRSSSALRRISAASSVMRRARASTASPSGVRAAALAGAVDQARAQFVLQRLDAAAQRRLRQVQAARRRAERALSASASRCSSCLQVHRS
jgi:hypothetical protein